MKRPSILAEILQFPNGTIEKTLMIEYFIEDLLHFAHIIIVIVQFPTVKMNPFVIKQTCTSIRPV